MGGVWTEDAGDAPRHQGQRMSRQRMRRRVAGACRQATKGQTLIIFALSLTVLIAMLGLAIDTVRIYDLYARMQRAAEAGALAGVLYMPGNYAQAYASPGDGNSAISRALEEVVKNGFGQPAPSPNYNDCPTPPNPSQVTVCSACPNPPTSIEVAVCPVEGRPTDITVTITETADVILLGAVGVGPTRITASAQAEYLPTIHIGSRTNAFGDEVECTVNGAAQSCSPYATSPHAQYFMASFTGPADLKESGDPMVYCAEGPAAINGVDPNQAIPTYNGYPTDHAQWPGITGSYSSTQSISQHCGVPQPGGAPGNPDQQPSGFDGPATAGGPHPGGYNYQIVVNSGVTGSLWIYNANYVPQDTVSPTQLPLDRFVDYPAPNFYQGPAGEGIGARFDGFHHDAPLFFFTTTFSLYRVSNLYDRTTDTLLNSTAYSPYDNTSADLSFHGCQTGQVYDPLWNGGDTPNAYYNASQVRAGQGCVQPPACMSQWCQFPVSGGLTPGIYRLVVEGTGLNANTSSYHSGSTDGYGSHSYALKVCDTTGLSTPIGCGGTDQSGTPDITIAGWNNMDILVQAALSQATPGVNSPLTSCVTSNATPYACADLGCIPTAYAGRTVTIGLFDPGDGSGNGNMYIGVVPPAGSGATVTYPSWASLVTVDGNRAVQGAISGSYRPFNGLWLTATVVLPPGYVGTCLPGSNSGWFQLMYASDTGMHPTDKLAVSFSLVGSPIHLAVLG